MPQAPERSTVGVEITFRDADGELIDPAAVTSFLMEVHGDQPGATNPIAALTSAVLPAANPATYVLDLSAIDADDVDKRLFVEWRIEYTSTTLGAGAILRSEKALEINLANSRIAT